ncbi:hypothetical protein [Gracilibacillus kekensis]|uniref:Tfp pilus assembly protein PilN n=1 Tax=Gracilibacillus kekensis TaxID=1027249 RepID=A0A1M7NWG6_9BACI|nr:hypothetical protein [Gracilibacillus kekensis]SHN08543.1 hypothetical protein SAMN05216179_1811 [Gracilibacillus kekensis]
MIEINFFEKRKKNIAPYILAGIFVIGLISIFIISYVITNQLSHQKDVNLAKIEKQTDIVEEYQKEKLVQSQVRELESQVSQIEEAKFPTVYLYQYVQNSLPLNTEIIEYRFSLTDRLYIRLQFNDFDQVAELQRSFVDTSFFEQVDIDVISLTEEEQTSYESELLIDIDRDQLSEVAENAD